MMLTKTYKILGLLCIFAVFLSCKKSKNGGKDEALGDVTYEISNEIFSNPERGFIKTYTVKSGGSSLNLNQLKALKNQNVSLILRVFYLDAFKDKDISESQLSLIQTDLDLIREAGLKSIVRFAYTDDMAVSDAPLNIVERHLDQLKPVFETNKDIIAFVQAGFIGAWGEWHSSSNGLATTENSTKVLNKLLSVLPLEIMVQVRTPGQKQLIFNTNQSITKQIAYTNDNRARVGHHNDCFLSNATNYGTYNNVVEDKKYISNEAMYVPVGGETCPPTDGYSANCLESRNEMKLLKWTYLNLDWYVPTIEAWRSSGCFDEFQRNLGYRLALVSANLPKTSNLNATYKFSIKITNNGYAPLYNKKNVSLVFKNKVSGVFTEKLISYDIRDCKPGNTPVIEGDVSLSGLVSGEYTLYLKIADQDVNLKDIASYSVRLANTSTWLTEFGGINDLKTNVTIM